MNYFYKKRMKPSFEKFLLTLLCVSAVCVYGTGAPASLGGGGRESRIYTGLPFLDVTAFAEDSLGYMWIATVDGLNRYNGYEFELFMNDVDDPHSLMNNFIFSLLIDSSGDFFIGTARGLCRFDFKTESFERFSSPDSPVYGLFEDHAGQVWAATPDGPGMVDKEAGAIDFVYGRRYVNVFWEDSQDRLWMGASGPEPVAVLRGDGKWEGLAVPGVSCVNCVWCDPYGEWWLGTNGGIYLFDPVTRTSEALSVRNGAASVLDKLKIAFIVEAEPHGLLIGTATDGFYHLDLQTGVLLHNMPEKYNPENSAQLHSCYVDRQGNVWIGTYEKGFVLVGRQSGYFNTDGERNRDFAGKFVTRVIQDASGALWVATRYDGLYRYDEEGGTRKVPIPGGEKEDSEFLECIYIDSGNRIWIAFETYMVVADIAASGRLANVRRLDMPNVRVIGEDNDGGMLVGSWDGLYRLAGASLRPELLFSANVTDFCVLDDGDVIFAAYGTGIMRRESSDGTISELSFSGAESRIAGNCVTMKTDSRGRLWLGSYGCGLMCIDGEERTVLTRKDGLPSDNILCFQEDRDGDIWASSSHGLLRIRDDGRRLVFSNYYNDRQAAGNQYHEKSGCVTGDGLIYFGGNHGLTSFSPDNFRRPKAAPAVHLEDLHIEGRGVTPSDAKGSVLRMDISLQREIVLSHDQRSIAIDYSGIDFFSPSSLTYKYRLFGEDDQWNYVGTHRRANYSNLRRGRYEFVVYAVNDDGVESAVPAMLDIRVKPAPWFSAAAWTVYFVAALSVVLLLMRSMIRARLSMERSEMDRKEKEREREMTRMKTNFFTNISHELRTPLTLIAGPMERLRLSEELSQEGRRMTDMISRNIRTMMRLLDQLMDFAKMENGALTLKVKETDIGGLMTGICESFMYLAERRGVAFSYIPHEGGPKIWVDADKIDKILNNLLSNALKYTPAGGRVILRTELVPRSLAVQEFGYGLVPAETFLKVSVDDSGVGVPKEKLGELFVRYRHIEPEGGGSGPDYGSNGIGLHYTRSLVERHGGRISASLKEEGGMIFSFILPAGDVYSDAEKAVTCDDDLLADLQVQDHVPAAGRRSGDAGAGGPTVLIVEDNPDLQDFLVSILSAAYTTRTASDGRAALEILGGSPVDLVLSDVIMPGMDGLELCRRIRGSDSLCHVPVVLLTAKTTLGDQLEGLEEGADAYICKPFSTEYLLLVVRNLLDIVKNVRMCYLTPHAEPASEARKEAIDIRDRRFMDSLTAYLEKELSNQSLDMDMVAGELCVSRSALYRRIKSLTGLSPNDCVRDYRLKRAVEFMCAGETLADVAERCGFSSYSYFSKSFKQHFGVSPKEWLKKRYERKNPYIGPRI